MELHALEIKGLLLAALLGAIIGVDREIRGKPAGFRTIILVTMGAALFSMVSYQMALQDPNVASDVTRIASNIVAGIGFLGAGIIFRTGQDVKGLTTAATVWIAAAIGMAAGIGSFMLAIVATAITWVNLFVLHYVERMVEEMNATERYLVKWSAELGTSVDCTEFFDERSMDLKACTFSKKDDLIIAEWTIRASKANHRRFIDKLVRDPRIVGLEH